MTGIAERDLGLAATADQQFQSEANALERLLVMANT
jgi:hypothetical protein